MTGRPAILVVDDEAIVALSLKRELLDEFGGRFLIETSLNAEDAIAVVDELVRDGVKVILIISDWLMPGMKGDEFLAVTKGKYPGTHCIIVSGQADPAAIERARDLVELDAFIRKPWARRNLLDAVRGCVDVAGAAT
ncbi:MAG TPA: response regulator [Spirochaetales bacterium]|nr:response regulator [Spirochaetales bacterium]